MCGTVLIFLELIILDAIHVHTLGFLSGSELLANFCLSSDLFADDLMSAQVHHIVLDGEVGAWSVRDESLVMNDEHYFRAELGGELSVGLLLSA